MDFQKQKLKPSFLINQSLIANGKPLYILLFLSGNKFVEIAEHTFKKLLRIRHDRIWGAAKNLYINYGLVQAALFSLPMSSKWPT